MKRPLILVALLYVVGILLATLPVPLVALFIFALALLIVFAVWPAARRVLLAALIILTGWINLSRHTAILSPNDLRRIVTSDENLCSVRGVLRDIPSHHIHPSRGQTYSNTIAQIDVEAVSLNQTDWQPAFGRIIVNTPGDLSQDFCAGETVEINGTLKNPSGAVAKGLFDYRNYLANQGIYYELAAKLTDDWRIAGPPIAPPLADRFRAWARKDLAMGLPNQDESLFLEWALTLGWKTALTDDVSDPFIKAATYHYFASRELIGCEPSLGNGSLITVSRPATTITKVK